MTAVVWHGRRDVRVQAWPLPASPKPGWVRVRVAWCGLCGSDSAEYARGPVVIPTEPHPLSGRCAPLVLGHEISGTVAAGGRGVADLAVGTPVVTDTLIGCEECARCRRGEVNLCPRLAAAGLSADGGLAEYVDVPAASCVRLPADLPLDVAALTEPLAVAVRAVRHARDAETTVVIGAGVVGLLIGVLAGDAGTGRLVVVEPERRRRELAARWLGADTVPAMTDVDVGADTSCVVYECSGDGAVLDAAIAAAPATSRIVLVGVHGHRTPVDLHGLLHKEIELVGSLSHDRHDFAVAAARLARESARFAQLIAHRVDLGSVVAALESLTDTERPVGKVLAGTEGHPWTRP